MKSIPTFLFFLAAICCFVGCYESKPAPKYPIDGAVDLNQPAPATPATPGAEPAQNAAGVWHYTCSNGCAGGAGAAGNCATCGNALAHNAAYHGNADATTPPAPTPATTETATSNITFTGDPQNPEPAQNAAGVWHYTCSNGCTGGAGSAVACATCGNVLAHNSAYH